MNLLVTSISKKVPLLRVIKESAARISQEIQIFGADSAPTCLGRFFVDHFWNMPLLEHLTVEQVIDYCLLNDIKAIIPTRDGELLFFSKHVHAFEQNGISVMISPLHAVERCLDKLEFYHVCSAGQLPVIPTALDVNQLPPNISYVVKERFGSGSKAIRIDLTKEQALFHADALKSPIFQPYICGKEISVDLYLNKQGRVKGGVCRTRDIVENGESQVSTTLQDDSLLELCSKLAEFLQLTGHVIFQVLIDEQGTYHIIECNCRIGGASTLSMAVGLDSIYWFVLESMGRSLNYISFQRCSKEKQLVRVKRDVIFEIDSKSNDT